MRHQVWLNQAVRASNKGLKCEEALIEVIDRRKCPILRIPASTSSSRLWALEYVESIHSLTSGLGVVGSVLWMAEPEA